MTLLFRDLHGMTPRHFAQTALEDVGCATIHILILIVSRGRGRGRGRRRRDNRLEGEGSVRTVHGIADVRVGMAHGCVLLDGAESVQFYRRGIREKERDIHEVSTPS